ncbi:replication protein [Citrobacter sp. RHBSTW-00446]|nr:MULTISPECIES: replication protein [unclassified Citrobacter]MBA7877231.1 replication protein [Citrobacter sp. RHBSTW-00827]MBA7937726.1 replication protein [Citrobacter sp. RHBSTW-00509]QLS93832.1 replication protein [Citrobacter sp. RHBSTW-00859]QLT53217.1 replication protein [Citrobacter sp. RHBSTW-00821]QLU29502.1 replication protein [Citrobacter sp. RHBSTW-00446]
MGVVKQLADYRPSLEAVERQVADLDDGYARLSNMLLEAYSGADLTKRHFKVLLAILRKTYGWNKPMDRISDSQLSEITKLPVKRCNEAKLELVRMNVIKQQGGMFGPNKNISEWCIPQSEGKSPKTRDKTSLKMRESYPSKQGDTKDTIQKKEKQDPPIPPEGDLEGAIKALEYYNELTGSSCRSAEHYLKLMTATKTRQAYTLQDVTLVTRWVIQTWKKKGNSFPKPENICRVKYFDGYLSDAEKWQREGVDIDCQAVIDAYNEVTDGRMPFAELYRDREIAIREMATHLAKKNVEGFRNYFKAFLSSAREFYFGGPDGSGWCANFDTLMELKTLRKVKEGSL